MPETHGQSPPSHSTLITADLHGSGFHGSNHLVGENTGDNVPETHGQSPPSHWTLISADLRGSGFHRSDK
ncbi:hypothetical protein [Oligosphaera ethanolica]|uniref:Uncharacterized protein n=1 Tax=Oligosphaera ethanolica TaxID=760260 RepID=A0AAE3VH00_9BACT|nr:hypothetical protein [Oligosphaera ethanolica]MDQ0290091.1 hypothetical protein [Oligosphaera ethanolica]